MKQKKEELKAECLKLIKELDQEQLEKVKNAIEDLKTMTEEDFIKKYHNELEKGGYFN